MNTLSEILNQLRKKGYTEDFRTEGDHILAIYSKKKYQPEDLRITDTFRFEGNTNPSDESELLVIEAKDGMKGTMTMAFGAKHSQDADLVKRIRMDE
jgi:hypothetical protein